MRKSIVGRAREDVALYNPAFLALLFRRCLDGYFQEHKEGLPLLLGHLGVSMALTDAVRSSLTMRVNTKLSTWISRSPRASAQIAESARSFSPYINESLIFALNYDVVRPESGLFIAGDSGPQAAIRGGSQEVIDCQRAANYLGRWFAVSGSSATVSALLGVKP